MTSNGTKKVQLVALLAAGHTYEECAARLGISKRTIVRLKAQPAFEVEVRKCRTTLLEQTLGLLAAEAAITIKTLVELRDQGAESTRLGACRTLLDKFASTREQLDVESRLTELERRLEKSPG